MGFNRRSFFKQTSFSFLTLGLFESGIIDYILPSNQQKKLQALAATNSSSTSRKLALLVGINEYPQTDHLRGCLTDVELQKELLIYRFGFNPEDILTLTDKEATRENIETVFEEHLIKQATNNDVVFFHFSGYGRQVQLPSTPDNSPIYVNSLMPYNGNVLIENEITANDLLFDTLISLGRSLKTNKITMVLDTSFQNSTPSLCKTLFIRTYPQTEIIKVNSTVLLAGDQIQIDLNNGVNLNLKDAKIPGLILSGSKEGISTEIVSNNFSSGLFTYTLNQYLWESITPSNLWISMRETASNIVLFTASAQKPNCEFNNINNNKFLTYSLGINEEIKPGGNGVITKINSDNTADLDLVGIPLYVLFNYKINSCFDYQEDETKTTKVQINSLQGNQAKVTILNLNHSLKEGTILRESVRVLPRNLGLNVALDSNLERIEKVDATSSLSSLPEIKSVINLGDDFADCILGKFSQDNDSLKGYGLFSTGGVLFPHTLGKNPNEAVSSASHRLSNPLKTLLAVKLLHLTFNQYSSLLPINVTLEVNNEQEKFLVSQDSLGSLLAKQSNDNQLNKEDLLTRIPVGSEICLNINNLSDKYLNLLLLVINSSGQVLTYFSPEKNVINGQQSLTIPDTLSHFKWIVNAAKGLGELILICSESPLNDTLINLYKFTSMKPDREQMILLDNPEVICKSILEDLHKGSKIKPDLISNLTDVYALDVNTWVTINFVYEIV
jgi:hypothetical protein